MRIENQLVIGYIVILTHYGYKPNIKTYPILKKSKLFFFKKEKDAIAFAPSKTIIVRCIAYNPKPLKVISRYIDDLDNFWKNGLRINIKSEIWDLAPTGTFVADSIKCLE